MLTWLAESALMSSPFGAFLKSIPAGVWKIVAIVAAVVGLFLLHQHIAHKAIADAEKRGSDAAYSNVAKQADKLTAKANALNGKLAAQMRNKNDEDAAAIRSDAGAVLVRGPGAARCAPVARLPASSGGRVAAGGNANASVDQMPDGAGIDLIGVPFAGAVAGAEQADLNRAEALAWREWYQRFTAEWAKWNADAAKARQPAG